MRIFTFLVVLGVGLWTAPVINAQQSKSPWTFGVKTGVNISTYNVDGGSDYSNTDGVIGFNGGVTVDYQLKNRFYLSSGLEFTTKGADFSQMYPFYIDGNTVTQTTTKDSRKFQYLQLPLTIGYRLPISRNMNVTFNAGGYFAFGLSGKGTYEQWTEISEVGGTTSYEYMKKKTNQKGDTDFGLIGGLGLEYKRFSLNFNYELGLRELYTGTNTIGLESTWKNRNAVLSVGYKF